MINNDVIHSKKINLINLEGTKNIYKTLIELAIQSFVTETSGDQIVEPNVDQGCVYM